MYINPEKGNDDLLTQIVNKQLLKNEKLWKKILSFQILIQTKFTIKFWVLLFVYKVKHKLLPIELCPNFSLFENEAKSGISASE